MIIENNKISVKNKEYFIQNYLFIGQYFIYIALKTPEQEKKHVMLSCFQFEVKEHYKMLRRHLVLEQQ